MDDLKNYLDLMINIYQCVMICLNIARKIKLFFRSKGKKMSADFRKQLNAAYEKKVSEPHKKLVADISLQIVAKLNELTPVDTSRATSNWHLDLNTVDVTLVEPGHDVEGEAHARLGSLKIGDVVYISNNMPYIRRLNEGSSVQAAAGFVEESVQVGIRKGKELAKQP